MRALFAILVICLVTITVLGGRYLVFEYQHGDRTVANRLLAQLS